MGPETIPGPEVNMDPSRGPDLTGKVEAEFPSLEELRAPEGSSADRASLIAALKNAPMGSKLREEIYRKLNWAQDHTTTGYKGPQTTPPPPPSTRLTKPSKKETPKAAPKPTPKPTAQKPKKFKSVVERGKAAQEKRKKGKEKREARKKQRIKNRGGQKFHIADIGLEVREIKEGLDDIFGGV
jgi:hypothetical protein